MKRFSDRRRGRQVKGRSRPVPCRRRHEDVPLPPPQPRVEEPRPRGERGQQAQPGRVHPDLPLWEEEGVPVPPPVHDQGYPVGARDSPMGDCGRRCGPTRSPGSWRRTTPPSGTWSSGLSSMVTKVTRKCRPLAGPPCGPTPSSPSSIGRSSAATGSSPAPATPPNTPGRSGRSSSWTSCKPTTGTGGSGGPPSTCSPTPRRPTSSAATTVQRRGSIRPQWTFTQTLADDAPEEWDGETVGGVAFGGRFQSRAVGYLGAVREEAPVGQTYLRTGSRLVALWSLRDPIRTHNDRKESTTKGKVKARFPSIRPGHRGFHARTHNPQAGGSSPPRPTTKVLVRCFCGEGKFSPDSRLVPKLVPLQLGGGLDKETPRASDQAHRMGSVVPGQVRGLNIRRSSRGAR